VIAAVCASRDLKCELIRGYVEGKSVPVFQGRWFTPAGYLGGTKAGNQFRTGVFEYGGSHPPYSRGPAR
jgi:hypothetical protein